MKLICYLMDGHSIDIRPAPVEREWMDHTGERFAYRCLPLNIANAHGWEILCPAGFTAVWNGNQDIAAVSVKPHDSSQEPMALSHFGHGTLTFHIPCLFRTEPGWDLMAQGPINRPKDGIAALTGIIETDWAPYTFTMNWIFTQPEVEVHFEKGEPFCHIFPVERGKLATVEPEIRLLSSEPELERQYKEWNDSRVRFNTELQEPGSQAQADRWQKMYYRGLTPDGQTAIEDHITRLRLKPFTRA
jgi:hypothetical protein